MNWRTTTIHFGKKAGTKLNSMSKSQLEWWVLNWFPKDAFCKHQPNNSSKKDREAGARLGCKDCILRLALDQADEEIFKYRTP